MNASFRPLRACLLACLLLALSAGTACAEKPLPYAGKTAVVYQAALGDTSAQLMLYSEKKGERTLLVYPQDDPSAITAYPAEATKNGVPFVLSGLTPAQRYTALLVVHDASAMPAKDFPYLSPIRGYAALSFTTPGLPAPQDTILMAYNITATSAHLIAFTARDVQVRLQLNEQTFWLRDGRCFQLTRMKADALYDLAFTAMRCPCDTAATALQLRTLQVGQGREPRPVGQENSPTPQFVCACEDAARCESNGCKK